MIYLIPAAAIIILLLFLESLVLRSYFRNKVKELYSRYGTSDKRVDSDTYRDVPPPVKRYFTKVLLEGAPYISSVRIRHEGYFKTNLNKGWKRIKGEQYYTAIVPGFIWKGRTSLFTATDSLIIDKGDLRVWFLSCLRIVNRSGSWIDQGELLRWLGETVWFPTSLLPSNYLRWEPVDDSSAKLIFAYKGRIVAYTVHFNGRDEIFKIEAMRFFKKGRQEKWVGHLGSYEYHNNFYIPTKIEAAWILDGTKRPYALFELTRIEYGIPQQFTD